MAEVGLFEAKTHLSKLVERVERGEEITLTRHGRPVARLTSMQPIKRTPEEIANLKAAFQALARKQRLDGVSIKELINDGRRYLDDDP